MTPTKAGKWISDRTNVTQSVHVDKSSLDEQQLNYATDNSLNIPTRSDGSPYRPYYLSDD